LLGARARGILRGMTAPRRLILAMLYASIAACGDDEAAPPDDSSTPMLDGSMMADAEAGAPEDAAMPDTGMQPDDAAMDAGADSGADSSVEVDSGQDAGADASSPEVTHAVLGARCALSERIGLIEIHDEGGTPYLGATFYDRPNAAIGAPEVDGEVCDFHRAAAQTGDCAGCDYATEVCSPDTNACAPAQQPVDDIVIEVIKGASSQTFEHEPEDSPGIVYGEVTLESPFGLEARWGTHTVIVAEQALPSGLTNLAGTLSGSYDAPESVDITWSGASEGFVFTRVPINHHVGGPTFTECAVEASANELHIAGEMLVPLAVVTGLEFQGIEHVYFAAAETDAGCVEIRYSTGPYFSLF
jgi:hypothetical protein